MRLADAGMGTFQPGLRQIPYLAEKQEERKLAGKELELLERRAIEDMLNAKSIRLLQCGRAEDRLWIGAHDVVIWCAWLICERQ